MLKPLHTKHKHTVFSIIEAPGFYFSIPLWKGPFIRGRLQIKGGLLFFGPNFLSKVRKFKLFSLEIFLKFALILCTNFNF